MDNNGAIWLNGAPSGASVTVFAPFPNWHPVNITSGVCARLELAHVLRDQYQRADRLALRADQQRPLLLRSSELHQADLPPPTSRPKPASPQWPSPTALASPRAARPLRLTSARQLPGRCSRLAQPPVQCVAWDSLGQRDLLLLHRDGSAVAGASGDQLPDGLGSHLRLQDQRLGVVQCAGLRRLRHDASGRLPDRPVRAGHHQPASLPAGDHPGPMHRDRSLGRVGPPAPSR